MSAEIYPNLSWQSVTLLPLHVHLSTLDPAFIPKSQRQRSSFVQKAIKQVSPVTAPRRCYCMRAADQMLSPLPNHIHLATCQTERGRERQRWSVGFLLPGEKRCTRAPPARAAACCDAPALGWVGIGIVGSSLVRLLSDRGRKGGRMVGMAAALLGR